MHDRNRSRVRTWIAIENLERRFAMAADFSLLVDSNQAPAWFPQYAGWTSEVGSDVVFRGDSGSSELWKIQSGETGTAQKISDFGAVYGAIVPATAPLSIGERTVFQAGDLAHGAEVWSTDGTPVGTFMLRDIFNGPGSSSASKAVRVGSTAYFFATDAEGRGLWRTDGTVAGTSRVLSRYDSNNLSFEEALGEFQGQIYFIARDRNNVERHLATIDPVSGKVDLVARMSAGQSSEILALKDRLLIANVAYSDKPNQLLSYQPQDGSIAIITSTNEVISRPTVLNGLAFFSVAKQLWTTDGTSAGTQLLVDNGVHEYRPRPLGLVIAAIDNQVLLVANGNYTVKDLLTGKLTDTGIKYPGHPYNTSIAVAGDQFVFFGIASDGSFNLYAMQRDAVLPEIVRPIDDPHTLNHQPNGAGGGLVYPSTANGRVFMPLRFEGSTLLHEYIPSTREVVAVAPVRGTLGSDVTLLEHSDSTAWFSTKSGPNEGVKLWQTDGSPAGTREIVFPAEAGTPWLVQMPQVIDGRLVVEVASAQRMTEFVRWSVDPATGQLEPLGIVEGLSVSKVFELNNERFQLRYFADTQLGLYRLNNDLSVGDLVAALPPPVIRSNTIEVTYFGDRVLFIVDSQFWQTNGTAAGTFPLSTGTNSKNAFQQPLVVGDKAWLITNSREFYLAPQTGSEAEYVGKLPDQLAPWTHRFQDSKFFALGDKLAFIGTLTRGEVSSWISDGNLWITDGTAAGTQLVRDFARGREEVSPRILGVVNGKAIIASGNARSGFDLWASDGTPEHTGVILHSDVGDLPPESTQTFELLSDGRAILQSFYPQVGREIVITDGSRAGTQLFTDIAPGSTSSFAHFVVAGQHIVAAAQTLEHGRWEVFGIDYRSYVDSTPAEMSFYVDEEVPGAFLGVIVAGGIATGGDTVFRLRNGADAGRFELDPTTGELRLQAGVSLDFEAEREVSLTVEIDYRDSVSGEAATRIVPVTVQVINQVEPPELDPQTIFVEENLPVGSYLGTIVTKHDSASNLSFLRTGGWPVRVDPASGRLYVLDPTIFDYERASSLIVSVQVFDPITGFRDEAQLTLQVQDVDEPPAVNVRPPRIDLFSGSSADIILPADTFVDPEGQPVSYSLALSSGDPLPSWIAFDASARRLRLSPASEHVGVVALRLTATDSSGHSASTVIDVTVFDGQFSWHNVVRPNDVNRDGFVTALDALLVINQLNVLSSHQLSDANSRLEYFYDSSADGWISPIDALLIINAINTGEGEAQNDRSQQVLTPVDAAAAHADEHDQALLASLAAFENENKRLKRHRATTDQPDKRLN